MHSCTMGHLGHTTAQFTKPSHASLRIGKGFQGVMKKHGMKGMPASHGVTLTHRKMGGAGGSQVGA